MESPTVDRESLFASHRHLCRRGARRFLRRGLERADLEQVAAIGLLKARDRYDARAATPFAIYAWRMILGELSHHVRDHEHLVRPPRKLQELERRYASEWERLSGVLGREPVDAELAEALGTTRQTAAQLRHLLIRLRRTRLVDSTVLDLAPPVHASVPAREHEELLCLRRGLDALSPLERRVVVGIYWCELPRTVLGRKLGVRPSTVANLHDRALRRLREHCGL